MKALIDELLDVQSKPRRPDPSYRVSETIESMSDDEKILLCENGIDYILWLRERNPSLLKTLAADVRGRREVQA